MLLLKCLDYKSICKPCLAKFPAIISGREKPTSCYTLNGTLVCCCEVTAVLDISCTLAMPPRIQLCYVRLGCFLQATHLEDWELIEEEHSNALNGCMEALESAILRVPVTGGARVMKLL